MIPYDTCDVEINECRRIAKELRASGRYRRVHVRTSAPTEVRYLEGQHRMMHFGRIYVERIQ